MIYEISIFMRLLLYHRYNSVPGALYAPNVLKYTYKQIHANQIYNNVYLPVSKVDV